MFRTDVRVSSSQGAIGYIAATGSGRLKGLLTDAVRDMDGVQRISAIIQEGIGHLDNTGNSRLTVRTVTALNLVESMPHVEGVIPLPNGSSMSGYGIVYLGYNKEGRRTTQEQMEAHASLISKIESTSRYSHPERIGRLQHIHDSGFTTQILNGHVSQQDLSDLFGLFQVHNYNQEEATKVMNNQNTIIATSRDAEGRIVAMSALEIVKIQGNDYILQIAEITDSVVKEEFRNNGLNLALGTAMRLLDHMQRQNIGIDILYGEANLGKPGSLVTNSRRGLTFYNPQGGLLGILPQHATIDGTLKDLALIYLTRDQIKEIVRHNALPE